MPMGDIMDPTKVRTEVIQGQVLVANTSLSGFYGGLQVGTTIHSSNMTRTLNSQEITIIIVYELP
tara:strand:+ start:375 stop:569 length:195 start_codon:yes stop_codon:yes gene_type:complete